LNYESFKVFNDLRDDKGIKIILQMIK